MEKEQFLEELEKVEREFHGKSQAQLLTCFVQQEIEQQQAQARMLDDKSSEKVCPSHHVT